MVVALSTLVVGLKAATLTWFGIKGIKFGVKLGKSLIKEQKSLPKFPSGNVKKFYKHKAKGVSRHVRPRFTRSQYNISEGIKEIIEECLNDVLISSFHNNKNQKKNAREGDDDEIINSMVKSNFSGCSRDCDCCIASQSGAIASLATRTYESDASPNGVDTSLATRTYESDAGPNGVDTSLATRTHKSDTSLATRTHKSDASLSSSTSPFSAITNEKDASLSSSASLFSRLAAITNECEASLASSSSFVSKELQTLWKEWGPVLETGDDLSSTVDLNSTLEETLDCDPMLDKDDSITEDDNHVEMSEEVFDESRLVIDLEVNDKDTCDVGTDNGREKVIQKDFGDDEVVTNSDGDFGVGYDIINPISVTDDSMAENNQVELPEEVFDEYIDDGIEKVTTDLEEEANEVVVVCIKGNATFLNHTLPMINVKKEDVEDDEEYEVVTLSDDE